MKNFLTRTLASALTLTAATGCSLMHDDAEPCATEPVVQAEVSFIYDYNTEKTDLFQKYVGSAYVYVFEARTGVFVKRLSAHRSVIAQDNFYVPLGTDVLEPGKEYRLMGMAMSHENGYTASLDDLHAFSVVSPLVEGVSTLDDYRINLDVDNNGIVDLRDIDWDSTGDFDVTWTTRPGHSVLVTLPRVTMAPDTPESQKPADVRKQCVISILRVTNQVEVHLSSDKFTADTDPESFVMKAYFPSGNGMMDMRGTVHSDSPLTYYALKKEVRPRPKGRDDADTQKYDIVYTFWLSKVEKGDGSKLQLFNADESERLDEDNLNLSEILAQANPGTEGWDDEEFLDREFDFNLGIDLDQYDKPSGVSIVVSLLGWVKHLQDAPLN